MDTIQKINLKNKNKFNKITKFVNTIEEGTLSDGKYLTNGTYYENIFVYNVQNIFIDTTTKVIRDNKDYNNFGDYRKYNLIYQIKSFNGEIAMLKRLEKQYNIQITNKMQLIDLYIKYNKANRFVYMFTYNNKTYGIEMNKKQFKEFVVLFGRYSNTRKTIRINKVDNTIAKWAGLA